MSNTERDIDYLNRHRIIYKKYPTEKATLTFDWGWVYEKGTIQYYNLFNTTAKIRTLNGFKYNLNIIKHLNPKMTKEEFVALGEHMLNPRTGFIIWDNKEFGVDKYGVLQGEQALIDVWYSKNYPYNYVRHIVFKDGCGLSKIEKQKLSGKYGGKRGKKTTKEQVKQQMLYIRYNVFKKITHKLLADNLHCSSKTIQRNMSEDMVELKNKLNDEM